MTSSLKLALRNDRSLRGNFDFGPWYDHYIRPFGKCHPDFDTVVLGCDPRGVKVCKRRQTFTPSRRSFEGPVLYRYTRQMYDFNPLPLIRFDSFPQQPPNEAYNILNDYYKLDHNFNGTGVYNPKTCRNISEYALNG